MGGSLSLALKKSGYSGKITGILRSQKSLEEIKGKCITDDLLLEEDFIKNNLWNQFDFIVFSLPVDLTCQKINLLPSDFSGMITDLGSTKKEIIESIKNKFSGIHNYYSSHPMTGSEQSGALHSKEDLYNGRLCILTREENSSQLAIEKITEFWNYLGCKTIEIPANDHDEILAYLSHAPHLLSSLLVNWAKKSEKVSTYTNISPIPLSGGGFRDMSRIAGSNPEMWEAIISTNKEAILDSMIKFKKNLEQIIDILNKNPEEQSGFWKKYFEDSKKSRDFILKL